MSTEKDLEWRKLYNVCFEGWKVGLPETKCGSGSTIKNNLKTISFLNTIITKYEIESIADIGCGDFNWMGQVDLHEIYYIGYDWIWHTETLEFELKQENGIIEFRIGNVAEMDIFRADLAICKDVMIHMTNEQAMQVLGNILKSRPKYLLLTTYDGSNDNRILGNYAPINMEKEPFNVGNKIESLEVEPGKYLSLYENKA